MIGSSLRFQDFEVDAKARLTATATYGQAEVEAIRREAYAAGAETAAETVKAAQADHATALSDVLGEIGELRAIAERHTHEALDRFERLICEALSATVPAAASAAALHRLPDALQEMASTVADLSVKARASSETQQALTDGPKALSAHLEFVPDPALPFGSVHLQWPGGGAVFQADAAYDAMHAVLAVALSVGQEPAPATGFGQPSTPVSPDRIEDPQ